MSLFNVFDISGSALTAQTTRMTTTASNMSNADVVSNSANSAYKPRYPLFQSVQQGVEQAFAKERGQGVEVSAIVESSRTPIKRYDPGNPQADKKGYVFAPNVNIVEEMTNMISASRSYQMNVEVLNTSKQLMQRTLQLGQ